MHYQQVIERPRYEDFEIKYFDSNPWAHLGMGWTVENRLGPEKSDCSPYLNLNNIDPKWCVLPYALVYVSSADLFHLRYEANGGDVRVLLEQQNNMNAR